MNPGCGWLSNGDRFFGDAKWCQKENSIFQYNYLIKLFFIIIFSFFFIYLETCFSFLIHWPIRARECDM